MAMGRGVASSSGKPALAAMMPAKDAPIAAPRPSKVGIAPDVTSRSALSLAAMVRWHRKPLEMPKPMPHATSPAAITDATLWSMLQASASMPMVSSTGPIMIRRVAVTGAARATSIALNDQPSAVRDEICPACSTLIPICTWAT
jgi:hypothetical protein